MKSGSTVVEHSPYYLKVQDLSPANVAPGANVIKLFPSVNYEFL